MTQPAAHWLARLATDGYCLIPDALPPATISRLDADLDSTFAATPFSQGGFYGARTKRFGGLLKRSREAEALVRHQLVLQIVDAVLGPHCDRFNLNLTQTAEIHAGALSQIPHRDQDMWAGTKGQFQYLINVMWPLTPFTAENGATRVWPGTHHGAPEIPDPDDPGVAIEMDPGAALLFLGSVLHGGGANRSDAPRRGVIVSYCLGWLKPFENQWLVYPPDIARSFDPELAALVGYSLHRPNLGNVEGQCPSRLLEEGLPEHLAAIDALLPDQERALADHVAEQEAARAGLSGG